MNNNLVEKNRIIRDNHGKQEQHGEVGSVGVRERSSKEAAHFYEFYLLNDILFNFVDGPPPIIPGSFLIPHSSRRRSAHIREISTNGGEGKGKKRKEKERRKSQIISKNLLISGLKFSESAGKK